MKKSLVILVALLTLAMVFVSCGEEPEAAIKYTVTYNANGGEGSIESKTVTSGTKITLAENTFTKTGYHSDKWAFGTADDALTQDANTEYEVTGDVTLYAVWEANEYYVDCYPNGGTGEKEYVRNTLKYDEESTLYTNDFERAGFTFNGWNTKADGTGTAYADGAKISNLSTENGGIVKLYAQWQTKMIGTWNYSQDYNDNGTDDLIINVIVKSDGTYSFTMTEQDCLSPDSMAESGTYEILDSGYVKMILDEETMEQGLEGAPTTYIYCKDKTANPVEVATKYSADLTIAGIDSGDWTDFTIDGSTWTNEYSYDVSTDIKGYDYTIFEFNDGLIEKWTMIYGYKEGDTLLYESNTSITADCAEPDAGEWSYVLSNFEGEGYDTCKYSLSEDCNTLTIYKMSSSAQVLTRVEE